MKKNKLKLNKLNGGFIYNNDSYEVITNPGFIKKYKNKISLIFTSPPFALNTPKSYGNKKTDEYVEWFSSFAKPLTNLLNKKGSIVIEMGNSWTEGEPTMSLTTYESLVGFMKSANLKLCQEFIWNNTAKLPGPAQWVTKKRLRAKDSFTKIWWLSKTAYPYADNTKVLKPYSRQMEKLLSKKKYNHGERSSGHKISSDSFLSVNNGSIASNVFNDSDIFLGTPSTVIEIANTGVTKYVQYCKKNNLKIHPARMPVYLPLFFINFLTKPGQIVLDPFAGSNTTGYVASCRKRKWVSIEKDSEYITSSKGWFKKNIEN